ncbi:TPA: M10 family metallopeptidase [Yersinia enterocolitica]|nr:M10 family metallopeptidase [Yersinia enterocolitica]
MFKEETKNHIRTLDTNKRININYKSKDINLLEITSRNKWEHKDKNGISIVTYSFSQTIPIDYHYYKSNDGNQAYSLNAAQINQARTAMLATSDVANIKFIEAEDGVIANIPIANVLLEGSLGGYAYRPNPGNFSPIFINANKEKNLAPTQSNYGGRVFMHEFGHALGLKHTHGSVGLTQQTSVMSYLSEFYSGAIYEGNFASTPQLHDISALQYLYGTNNRTRIGNTTYGFNSNSNRGYFTATNANDKLVFCVWDAGGNDTFDFSGYHQDQMINLNQGSFSNVGGLIGNVSIALNVAIENAIGGSGNDILIGNQEKNTLTGGDGDDRLYGGKGADHLFGGNGRDIFGYRDINDSTLNAADTIYDFETGHDKIDLSDLNGGEVRLVDAITTTGNRRNGHTQVAQFYSETSDLTYLMIDFDYTDKTDIVIKLASKHQLTTHDFISAPLLTA